MWHGAAVLSNATMVQDAAQRAAQNVLAMIHQKMSYEAIPFELICTMQNKGTRVQEADAIPKGAIHVETTDAVEEGRIILPPCIMKPTNLRTSSVQASRVPITVRIVAPQDKGRGKGLKSTAVAGDKSKKATKTSKATAAVAAS